MKSKTTAKHSTTAPREGGDDGSSIGSMIKSTLTTWPPSLSSILFFLTSVVRVAYHFSGFEGTGLVGMFVFKIAYMILFSWFCFRLIRISIERLSLVLAVIYRERKLRNKNSINDDKSDVKDGIDSLFGDSSVKKAKK